MSYFDEEKYENTEENKDVTPSADTEAHGVAYSPAEDGSYRLTSYVPSEQVAAPKKKGGKGKVVDTKKIPIVLYFIDLATFTKCFSTTRKLRQGF